MRWPPQISWSSANTREGSRHYQVLSLGGKGEERRDELSAVMDKNVRFEISWCELKNFTKCSSGWLQLLKDEDEQAFDRVFPTGCFVEMTTLREKWV